MVLVSAARPAADRDSPSISGSGSARAARRMVSSIPKAYCRSPGDQKPAGDSAVTDRTSFSRPNSRASSPPREFPATWGRSISSASQNAPRAEPTVVRSYETPWGSAGDVPKPGRSMAMTSRSAARMPMTGSQACQWCPMPCRSSSGSPLPARS